jgi:hypothetical protein
MIRYLPENTRISVVERLVRPKEDKSLYDFMRYPDSSCWYRAAGAKVFTTRSWRWEAEDEHEITFYLLQGTGVPSKVYKFIRFKAPLTTGELGFLVDTSLIHAE